MFSRLQSLQLQCKNVFFLIGETRLARLAFILVAITFVFAINAQAESQTGKLRKQAEKAMRQGEFETATNLWQEVLRAEPENHNYRLRLSYALYKQRRLLESFNEAMTVNKAEPNNPRVRSILGSVYLLAGQIQDARALFNDALFRNREDALGLAGSAMIDFYENRSKIGLDKLRYAVYLEPNEPDFIFSLAQIAARTENYKESADAYETFLRISPPADLDRRARIEGLIKFLRYIGNIGSLYDIGGEPQTLVDCEIINNRPVIKVRLNGRKEPLRFVLDTGSGMTVISEQTAERLGIKPIVRGGMARAVGGGGKFQIVYGFVKSLEIGGARVARVPVYIRKFNETGDSFDGYIGLSAISKFLVTLDYVGKTFSLERNVEIDKNNGKAVLPIVPATQNVEGLSVPLRTTSSGFLSSEVKIEGVEQPLNFILDTGASVSVVSVAAAQRNEISRFAHTAMLRVFGAAGVTENVTTLILPKLSLGKTSRDKITAAVLDLAPVNETTGFEQAGILGGNFLLHYRLKFNFQDSTVIFEPASEKSQPSPKPIVIGDSIPN
jgi:predicted aspartyl protease/cytochrome c-type biogenesis protein CcmH/NrfG